METERERYFTLLLLQTYMACIVFVVFNLSYGKETCTYFLSLLHYLFLD